MQVVLVSCSWPGLTRGGSMRRRRSVTLRGPVIGGIALSLILVVGLPALAGNARAGSGVVCCGGGGGPRWVNYTLEDWGGSGAEINNTWVAVGGTQELQPGVPVPATAYSDPGVTIGWSSTGGGSWACPGCVSTTFTPGDGGFIYLISSDGSANWGGYFLGDNGGFKSATTYIWVPPQANFSGPTGSTVSYWVGLGGESDFGEFPFWQAGVEVQLPNTVFLWYEAFQSSSSWELEQKVTSSVTFGSVVEVDISFQSAGGYVCFYLHLWSSCHTDTLLAGDTSAATAEWIAEAPTLSGTETILPDFSGMAFNHMGSNTGGGQLFQLALVTCFDGASCQLSGQTMTPGDFVGTGDFVSGFRLGYSGAT